MFPSDSFNGSSFNPPNDDNFGGDNGAENNPSFGGDFGFNAENEGFFNIPDELWSKPKQCDVIGIGLHFHEKLRKIR